MWRYFNRILMAGVSKTRKPNQILGVTIDSSEQEIRKAYYTLAKKHHPDVNCSPHADAAFNEISQAYEKMLKRPKHGDDESERQDEYEEQEEEEQPQNRTKRSRKKEEEYYSQFMGFGGEQERFLREFLDMMAQMNNTGTRQRKKKKDRHGNPEEHFGSFYQTSFAEEFNEQFVNVEEERMPNKQKMKLDIHMALDLGLEDTGTVVPVVVARRIRCEKCDGGNRHSRQSKRNKCKKCHGCGYIARGKSEQVHVCSLCEGRGTGQKKRPCEDCHGNGTYKVDVEEQIKIKQNLKGNSVIEIKGKGHQHLKRGVKGNLFIQVNFFDSAGLKREGSNTFEEIKITIADAALGCVLKYKTIWGEKAIKLKAGVQDKMKIKRAGEGYRHKNNQKEENGDHYIEISVLIPTKIKNEELRIFEQLKQIEDSLQSGSSS